MRALILEKTYNLIPVCNPAVISVSASDCLCPIISLLSQKGAQEGTRELTLTDTLEECFSPNNSCSILIKILVNFEQLGGKFFFAIWDVTGFQSTAQHICIGEEKAIGPPGTNFYSQNSPDYKKTKQYWQSPAGIF